MARLDSSRRWYLFDYGNVISTPPTPQDWEALAEAVGIPGLQEPTSTYWLHRYAYDAGSVSSDEYWSLVSGEQVTTVRAAWLDILDGNQWSHPNLEVLDVLEDLEARGERLALLSNMPAAMVSHLRDAPWTKLFQHLFFSSSLRLVKPSAGIFEHVLTELAVDPGLVTFVDDSPANIAAAHSLGIDARLFEPSSDLSRSLVAPGRKQGSAQGFEAGALPGAEPAVSALIQE
jgi:putative hydrolase of the HAD superfamily